jgi:cytochrome P450
MNKELVQEIRCNLFASRDTVAEALEYALTIMSRDPAMLTALYVVLNTVANQIELNQ